MIKVGITGGIGSGKSTLGHLFEMMGYPVYYADIRAKWLMNNDPIIKAELMATFGKSVYPDELDRKALADIVFSNPDALAKLNSITHPAVRRDQEAWSKKQSSPIVFKEAAILFESGTYRSVDKVICVVAPEITRIMRVMKRDGATAAQVQERISNQWADEKKAALSDFIIHADEQQLVIPQALAILKQLEQN
ncbi:MAG: dephospho-CoA kinase [Bacteroidales bacterium]|jgi:dephospho-CoA kinase|nr:dephospho-CoA kinase [Bacteroidales bacterium]